METALTGERKGKVSEGHLAQAGVEECLLGEPLLRWFHPPSSRQQSSIMCRSLPLAALQVAVQSQAGALHTTG